MGGLKDLMSSYTGKNNYLTGRWRAGVSLVEVLVSLVLITVGIFSLMHTFSFIQKATQQAKNRTLASNLAQEKMQILKQKSYYQVIVTSIPAHDDTSFYPESLEYDAGYFPPETITEGGVEFTRYTYIQAVREDSGSLGEIPPNSPDTGMKRITINVVWGYGNGKRKVTLRSILSNQDTIMANVSFNGVIASTMSARIGGALMNLVEASGKADTTDSSGLYYMTGTPGTYTLMASATGYYTQLRRVVAASGSTLTNNFTMVAIGKGMIVGFPWLKDHLVVSQVVGSTVNTSQVPAFDQEYVEVFNPSTYTWTMNGQIGLKFQRASDAVKKTVHLTYVNDSIPSGGYYLFANTSTITADGVSVNADAIWSTANSLADFPLFGSQSNIIPVDEDGGGEGGGALELYRISDGTSLDRVGWNKTSHPAPFYESSAIIQTIGLSRNELYARYTSTTDISGVNDSYGPAYDSNDNSKDFYDYTSGIAIIPHNSSTPDKDVIAGTPAGGAVVTCSDGLSSSAQAIVTGNPPYAYFSLVDVATGTWTVFIASGVLALQQTDVHITSGVNYTFASTSTFLVQENNGGIISGRVVNVTGFPLNGIIVTSGGANTTVTGANGNYNLQVSTGVVDITANPAQGGTASYVTASSVTIPIQAGEAHGGVNFVLYQGGRISGFVTMDGAQGLPNVAVAILDDQNVARDQQVSGTDGRFTSVVLSTGYYTVQPIIGSLETVTPISKDVSLLTMGSVQFSSIFTVSGALGYVRGSVSYGGLPIRTGVLIIVTTNTLAGVPPAPLNISSNTANTYFTVSSDEGASYTAEVRGSTNTTYNVYAYYPVPNSTGVTMYSQKIANVSVIAGQTTSGVNFGW